MKKITLSVAAMALLATTAMAAEEVKVEKPKPTNIQEMFAMGEVDGRIRFNSFYWDYAAANTASLTDNGVYGVGGSLIYSTAKLGGLSATAGMYYSTAFTDINQTNISWMRAGKDLFSRQKVKELNDYTMMNLAQAYIQYDLGKTTIKVGQQLWNSLLTNANDTKMIPNSFMGVTVTSKDIAGVEARAFYFTSTRLRDHEASHDFVTFQDENNASWMNNDDAAINKALKYSTLKAAGMATDHDMNGADITYTGIKGLKATVTHNMVPEIVLQEAAEASYKVEMGDISITPAARVIVQKDLVGGKLDGKQIANLGGKADDYSNANSLSGYVWMAKVAAATKNGIAVQYGYSQVADMADMLAPWRGFATGGYTRAMAQYNWNANTITHMLQAKVDLGKMKVLEGSSIVARYAIQDFDDKKSGVQGDSNIVHIDINQKLDVLTKGLSAKIRLGLVQDARGTSTEAQAKTNPAYNEYRFEVNYLF